MKKLIISLFVMIVAVCGNAQTIGDAFYIYRNDGMINTFFRSEIDSLAYSYFDADSTKYEEIVTQVVYTGDSIYQIPLAAIDSISFVTPETTYKPGVIRLDGEVRDWIIGSDRRVVYFRSNTPKDILPKIGDKLVTTEMSETFNGGFLGMVESKEEKPDTIALHCSEIGLEEVFEYFYYSSSNDYQSMSRRSKKSTSGKTFSFTPIPFVGSFSDFLQDNIIPEDCPVQFSPQLDIVIAPSFHGRSSIIVHPLKGVVVSADITQQTTTTIDFGLSGEIGVSHDFTPGAIPLYAIAPFIYLYGELGAFIRANGNLSLEEHWTNSLNYNIHFEVAYNPLIPALLPIPKYKINGVESYTNHYGQCMFDGHGEVGLYGELGIELWKKDIASIGFRVEGGMMIGGNVMIYNTDDPSLFSTSTYNKLRSAEIYKKAFARIGLQGKLIGTDNVDEGLFEHEWDLGNYKLVPDFSNTTLSISDSDPHFLRASANVSGEVLFPCELGFHLFEGNNTKGIKNQHPINYYGGISSFADIYTVESLSNKYTLYPTVKLFNTFEMLATPSVECIRDNTPIVLEVIDSDITETSAKCRAYIKGDNNSDEVFKCGIGFNEKGKGGISYCPYEDSVKAGEIYTVNIGGLEPGTTYEYFAYYELNNERICSDKKEFTTKGQSVYTTIDIRFKSLSLHKGIDYYTKYSFPEDQDVEFMGIYFNKDSVEVDSTSHSDYSFYYPKNPNDSATVHVVWKGNLEEIGQTFEFCEGNATFILPSNIKKAKYTFSCFNYGDNTYGSINVILPEGFKELVGTFDNCHGKVEIHLPSTIEVIGFRAFARCTIDKLDLPKGLKKIGKCAFQDSNITTLEVPESVEYLSVSSLGNNNFTSVVLNCYDAELEVEGYSSVFGECEKLTNVTFNGNWQKLPNYLFSGCWNLTTVKLPNSIKEIGYYCFCDDHYERGCPITHIDLPKNLEIIRNGAFKNTNLSEIDLPESLLSIGAEAFENTNIKTVLLPPNIKSVGGFPNTVETFYLYSPTLVDGIYPGPVYYVPASLIEEYKKKYAYEVKYHGLVFYPLP